MSNEHCETCEHEHDSGSEHCGACDPEHGASQWKEAGHIKDTLITNRDAEIKRLGEKVERLERKLTEAREALGRAVLAMERAEADLHLAGQQIWGRLPGLSDGLDAARAALRRIAEGGGA